MFSVQLDNFVEDEFDYPNDMNERTLVLLDCMVTEEKKHQDIIFIVHCDYRPGDPRLHGEGKAIDGSFRYRKTGKCLPVLKQFLMAMKYTWGGVGFYPYWNNPGIHIDTRLRTIYQPSATWWKDEDGEYKGIFSYLDRFKT